MVGELLRSPGVQRTELVQGHYGKARVYRIDARLLLDIPLDGTGSSIEELEAIGHGLPTSSTGGRFSMAEVHVHPQDVACLKALIEAEPAS